MDVSAASSEDRFVGTRARAEAERYLASCACFLAYSSLASLGRGSGRTVATAGARPSTVAGPPRRASTAAVASRPPGAMAATATTPETTATAPRPRRVHVSAPERLVDAFDSRSRSSSGASSARASFAAAGDAGVMTPRGNILADGWLDETPRKSRACVCDRSAPSGASAGDACELPLELTRVLARDPVPARSS